MAVELTATPVQTVTVGNNILFNNTPVCCTNGSVVHRDGAGIVTLKGNTCQCRALYKVSYGANIAVATGGTLGAISIALTINGEELPGTEAIATPAAIGDFFSVSRTAFIAVPKGCCYTISAENTSATSIDVENANLVIERVA